MKSLLFLLLVSFTSGFAVIVDIPGQGQIQGVIGKTAWSKRSIFKFFSIKYGESPTGKKRFMPPELKKPWKDVFNATSPGVVCPNIDILKEENLPSVDIDLEDCLSMNIFTPIIPRSNETVQLPVMVFIHGGTFVKSHEKEFRPDYLLEHDVLLVVLQYRLGLFGFLCLHTDEMPGNAGMLDQVLALSWINKHIKHFGGDNNRVTIFGHSSGACSVSLHLLSPVVDPSLFQQVIVQSGSSFSKWFIDEDPVRTTIDVYNILTNTSGDVDLSVVEKTLKSSSVIDLSNAVLKFKKKYPTRAKEIGKVVIQKTGEIKYLTEHPDEIINTGLYRDVPMMGGVTKHDGSFLVIDYYDDLEEKNLHNDNTFIRTRLLKFVLDKYRISDTTGTLEEYFEEFYFNKLFKKNENITFHDISFGLIDLTSVFIIKGQVLKLLKNNLYKNKNTYLYTFDYYGEYTRFGYGKNTSKYPFFGGVTHADDLLYLFPFPYETLNKDTDIEMSKMMSELWTSFASTGKPSSSLLKLNWPKMEKGKNGPYLHINEISTIDNGFVKEFRVVSNEAGF